MPRMPFPWGAMESKHCCSSVTFQNHMIWDVKIIRYPWRPSLFREVPLSFENPLTYRPASSPETGNSFLESAGESESLSPPPPPNPFSGQPTIRSRGTQKRKLADDLFWGRLHFPPIHFLLFFVMVVTIPSSKL
ncbi:hypothetical protein AVEN_53476-1 [Araneus ventricosus]|uniref:Uncharacterized protein n=1 Tax=Araneus ventricosus TaxID=182803 RepID=A0A4Y2ACY0_ARAVE|nr:hypothetical protein AVEN_53476-1 [Araneus ventricosus]